MNRGIVLALIVTSIWLGEIDPVEAEIIAPWDRVSMTSNELSFPIEVRAERTGAALSKLIVRIGDSDIIVPDKDLTELNEVSLRSLKIGYHSKTSKTFYVSVVNGKTSSFPGAKQPVKTFFEFKDGEYFRAVSLPVSQFVGH